MTPCPQNVMDKAELEKIALDTLVMGGLTAPCQLNSPSGSDFYRIAFFNSTRLQMECLYLFD